jgi:S1-C subfamily serine protease
MRYRLALIAAVLAALTGAVGTQASPSDVRAATVRINTTLGYQDSAAIGTGIVIGSNGLVLTNNHVIRGATSVRATVAGSGRTYRATVLGYSPTADVAVLQLDDASGLPTVAIGGGAHVGESVTTLGNAGGNGGLQSSSTGRVTAVGRSITVADDQGGTEHLAGLIQTDASLRPGDSGGPVIDSSDHVIGMDTAAMIGFQFRSTGPEGYAIPIARALALVKQIQAGRSSANVHVGPTAMLGIRVGAPSAYGYGSYGALVIGVVPGSPADRAGLQEGDVLTALGGTQVGTPDDLTHAMLRRAPSDSVSLTWLDQLGAQVRSTVRLASGPPQ